jgi:exodeoxyribonuclease III
LPMQVLIFNINYNLFLKHIIQKAMNKKVALLIIVFSLNFQVIAQTDPIKVMSYNIWNGFEWGKDKDREAAMVKWLKEQDADVIVFRN